MWWLRKKNPHKCERMVSNLPAFQSRNCHKEMSWNPKAHVLITYNISASFAISLVKTKSLLLSLKKIARDACEKPQWTSKQSCLSNFHILGTFTPLVQSFIPTNKAKSSVKAQMAVKCFKCKLPSSYSCWANSAQMKLPAPKLKHSQRMVTTTFNFSFHNEGYTWERQTKKESRLIYTALQEKNPHKIMSLLLLEKVDH